MIGSQVDCVALSLKKGEFAGLVMYITVAIAPVLDLYNLQTL